MTATLEGLDGPTVTVDDGRLRVDGWWTELPQPVAFFGEAIAVDAAGGPALLEQAVLAGVVTLGATRASVDFDAVARRLDDALERVDRCLDGHLVGISETLEAVFADETGALPAALRSYLGAGGRLSELFDPNRRDSALGRMQDLLGQHLGGEGSTLHRLLDLTDARSPLHRWAEEQRAQFEALRRLINDYRKETAEQVAAARGQAAERERGTLKGRAYQVEVFDAVRDIARVFGDHAEYTADVAGPGGSKAGDVAVAVNPRDTLGAPVVLTFEAKDGDVGWTKILRELDAAAENREAAAAIGVYSKDTYMPRGGAPYADHGPSRAIALFDKETRDPLALQLAYRVARCSVLADGRAEHGTVDADGVRTDIEAMRGLLKSFVAAKAQLTKVRSAVVNGADDLEGRLDGLRHALGEVLDRLEGRLRRGEAEAA